MNAPEFPSNDLSIPAEFHACFSGQRAAFLKAPDPSHAERLSDLKALSRLLKDNQAAIIKAIDTDYGGRSEFETLFGEIFASLDGLRDAQKRLARWMRPRRRSVDPLLYPGARNRLIPQPLGVVGVIVPWNYPIFLSFGPLTGALAAGNRAMVKMSENSRALVELLAGISPKYLPEDKLAFFADGGGRGPAFSSLPFDYLFFTGSGTTGRAVMANAARNLTPVTLELGGKTPGKPASRSTTPSCPAGPRRSSSTIAGRCSRSGALTSTARTSLRSSISGRTTGLPPRLTTRAPKARGLSISRRARHLTSRSADWRRTLC